MQTFKPEKTRVDQWMPFINAALSEASMQTDKASFVTYSTDCLVNMLADQKVNTQLSAQIDHAQRNEFINYTGLAGAPTNWAFLKVDTTKVPLSLSDLLELFSQNNTMRDFFTHIDTVIEIAEEFVSTRNVPITRRHQVVDNQFPITTSHKVFEGDVFYHDIHTAVKEQFNKSPATTIIFSFICSYLREKGFWVHS